MIFKPDSIALIEQGIKTQTRRPVKDSEIGWHPGYPTDAPTSEVRFGTHDRIKWQVGRTYAVCPGRGKPSVGRIKLLAIRREPVNAIMDDDARAEGLVLDATGNGYRYGDMELQGGTAGQAYLWLWSTLYHRSDLTELCWVLSFELVKP